MQPVPYPLVYSIFVKSTILVILFLLKARIDGYSSGAFSIFALPSFISFVARLVHEFKSFNGLYQNHKRQLEDLSFARNGKPPSYDTTLYIYIIRPYGAAKQKHILPAPEKECMCRVRACAHRHIWRRTTAHAFWAPQNPKQRKRLQKGGWSWIYRASIGDEQAVLVPDDKKGFVVARFLTIVQD